MNIKNNKLLKNNKQYILENVKQAKIYVNQGSLSNDVFEKILNIDPTPTRKFVGWIAKQYINKNIPDLNSIKSIIQEYNVFLEKNKTKFKDINQFKTFNDLKKEVDYLNNSGEGLSNKDLENDYETITDNSDLLIICPHTHDASRKLGLSYFSFRDCEGGGKDSNWCTTYKAPDHFNDYYYNEHVTFYYIRVKSEKIMENLKKAFPKKYKQLEVLALVILKDGKFDAYDGEDEMLTDKEIKTYLNITGIS
jgi:hypothetical protein